LRAQKARPKPWLGRESGYQQMVRAMTFKNYSALIAALSAVALMLAASEASAGTAGPRGVAAAPRGIGHRPFVHAFRHNRGGAFGSVYWPGDYGDDGSAYGQAPAEVVPPASNDVHYTTTYDVPWDWAHRLPPQVAPSDRAYVPSCSVEGVSVPGKGGESQTVNVTRCY
jgi:hypothetical protein